jgi:hypothetical protein
MPGITLAKSHIRFIGAAALLALTSTSSVYAAGCIAPRVSDSQMVRALQSRLMIAALSCNARADYNRFVKRYRSHLAYHGAALRKSFRKKYGKSYRRALNKFITEMANGASQASINDRAGFCAESRAIFASLRATPNHRAPLTLQAVAYDTDWRPSKPKVCEAMADSTARRR